MPGSSAGGAASIRAAKAAEAHGSTRRDVSTVGGAQWARWSASTIAGSGTIPSSVWRDTASDAGADPGDDDRWRTDVLRFYSKVLALQIKGVEVGANPADGER